MKKYEFSGKLGNHSLPKIVIESRESVHPDEQLTNKSSCLEFGNNDPKLTTNTKKTLCSTEKGTDKKSVSQTQEQYKGKFHTEIDDSPLLLMAYKQAIDTRKFEIELYWKRATYFWALIAVTFAGYFSVIGSSNLEHKYFFSFLIACVGLVMSFAWFWANLGSKQWQENWENHVALLEDKVTGPLYKVTLKRPAEDEDRHANWVTKPLKLSVSKINQWVALAIIITWVILCFSSISISIFGMLFFDNKIFEGFIYATFLFAVTVFICSMFDKSKSYENKHTPEAKLRSVNIKVDMPDNNQKKN